MMRGSHEQWFSQSHSKQKERSEVRGPRPVFQQLGSPPRPEVQRAARSTVARDARQGATQHYSAVMNGGSTLEGYYKTKFWHTPAAAPGVAAAT
eukprot:COSAG01_NODE_315_length_19007_cov_18.180135_4_plen_94_part_00